MRKVIIIVFLLLSTFSFSQIKSYRIRSNSVFTEGYLLGNHTGSVGWFSINYGRRVGAKKITNFRVGLSADFQSSIGVPIIMTFITNPKGKHHFEGGIGVNNRIEYFQNNFHHTPFGMVPLMYRFDSNKGLLIRGGINYFFYSYAVWYPVSLQLGLSLGYSF